MKNSVVSCSSNQLAERIMTSFSQMEEKISNNILESIDKKLDAKMQNVETMAEELIQVKTENEKLKHKILELNKENVHLKMELEKFEKIGFGLYKKYNIKDYTI
jgi:predicted nuclease with TOPRIM domain